MTTDSQEEGTPQLQVPSILSFPLSLLKEAFGNCEVKLTKCENDPSLSNDHRKYLKEKMIASHQFKLGVGGVVKGELLEGNELNGVLPIHEKYTTTISFENCPFTNFKVVLIHGSNSEGKEGWSHEGNEHIYYAKYNQFVEVDRNKLLPTKENGFATSVVIPRIRKRNNKFECLYCNAKFTRRESVRKHQVRSCPFANPSLNGQKDQRTSISSGGIPTKPQQMPQRPKESSLPQQLLQNFTSVRVQSGANRRFKCTFCDKGFTSSWGLKMHVRSIHEGIKEFQCPICSRNFTRASHVRIHIESVHERIKPFKCSVCQKGFSREAALQDHRSIHLGKRPRPFPCIICKKRFYTLKHLRAHTPIHSDVKPYSCRCGSEFRRLYNLKEHIRKYHPTETIESAAQTIGSQRFPSAEEEHDELLHYLGLDVMK